MRVELEVFRVRQKMSKTEFADKLGVSRSNYSLIEMGKRNGTFEFWSKLQETFNVPDSEMWTLIKLDKE